MVRPFVPTSEIARSAARERSIATVRAGVAEASETGAGRVVAIVIRALASDCETSRPLVVLDGAVDDDEPPAGGLALAVDVEAAVVDEDPAFDELATDEDTVVVALVVEWVVGLPVAVLTVVVPVVEVVVELAVPVVAVLAVVEDTTVYG